MSSSPEEKTGKKLRRRWHERTLDKDIRYRGPLNYQHFQILGWLCIVASQAVLILSIGDKMGKLPESYVKLQEPLTYLSWLSLPFLMIANFAQIMNGQKSYKTLLLKHFGAAAGIFAVYTLILYRYILGMINMINDGTVADYEVLVKLTDMIAPSGVLSFNIFMDLFLCTLVMFFLNYSPKRFFSGKWRYLFRACALLPILYEAACIILKVLASRKEVTISPFLWPLFTVKPTMTFVLFVVMAVYIKTREMRFCRHGKTHEEYAAFLQTKKNSWDFSLFLAITLIAVSVIDYFVVMIVTRTELAGMEMTDELISTYQPIAFTMGFGDSLMLALMAPLVLLFSYTRKPISPLLGVVIPIASFGLIVLLYLEAGHQAIPMLDFEKMDLSQLVEPYKEEEELPDRAEDEMTLDQLVELVPETENEPAGETDETGT